MNELCPMSGCRVERVAREGPTGHENPPRLAASSAGDMAQAAQSGDMVAAALIRQATTMLAGAVRAAAARLTGVGRPISTAVIGGLTGLGPIFTDPLFAALDGSRPALGRVPARGTALDGAQLLALRTNTIHKGNIVREAAS